MTTVLMAYHNGTLIGRCDKTCYDAKGETCRCICNGHNHGAGLRLAHAHAKFHLSEIANDLRGKFPPDSILGVYHVQCHFPRNTAT